MQPFSDMKVVETNISIWKTFTGKINVMIGTITAKMLDFTSFFIGKVIIEITGKFASCSKRKNVIMEFITLKI